MKIFIDLENIEEKLQIGLNQLILSNDYAISKQKSENSVLVNFKQTECGGFKITGGQGCLTVKYTGLADAFRAIGYILGLPENKDFTKINHQEQPHISWRAVQLEASRNGVPTVDTVKSFIRKFALMGINALALYTEDTFEIEGEPFWGYLRGGYTKSELKELDNYAYQMGIEMFPCIQTLGHLKQVIQWGIAYSEVTDTDHILLVGEEKTYKLIEKVIKSISSCFRSNKIHIGMDEAHGLGTGQYKKINGERPTFDIINEHLRKVSEICQKFDLKPMIWSDMYFRLGSKNNDYYDQNSSIPQKVIDDIDSNIDLVYWDYYHKDKEFYDNFIDKHREMRKEPIVAPGAWTWGRFWCALEFSYDTILPCLQSCYDKKVSQVLLTTWGDNGMEVNLFSALPAMQFYAELCYNKEINKKQFANNLAGSCNVDLATYETASKLDKILEPADGLSSNANPSKWLLWDDPLIGLCEAHHWGMSFSNHYSELATRLAKFAENDNNLKFSAQLAKVLAVKCDIRKHFVEAYKAKDLTKLKNIINKELKPLIKDCELLAEIHRDQWLGMYKPFGIEVLEIRYGGLIQRLKTLNYRVESFVDKKIDNIPEFETKLLPFARGPEKSIVHISSHKRMATPSAIF